MRIYQIKCDNCQKVIEENDNGKIAKTTNTFYPVDDKDFCPDCFEKLKGEGAFTFENGFAQFKAR